MEELMKQLESKELLNEEMLAKLKECGNAEEILSLIKDNNVDCTLELAQDIYNYFNESRELIDDELESVAGGGCLDAPEIKCPNCGSKDYESHSYSTHTCAGWWAVCNKCHTTWS